MNFHSKTPAASAARPTPLTGGAAAVCPHNAADGGAAANLSALPEWARCKEATALLWRIAMERPARSRVIAQTMTGPGAYGYAGKAANQLRQLYDRYFLERMEWCAKAGHGTPTYWTRRTALLAYDALHGPDALIARMMGGAE